MALPASFNLRLSRSSFCTLTTNSATSIIYTSLMQQADRWLLHHARTLCARSMYGSPNFRAARGAISPTSPELPEQHGAS